MLPRIRIGVDAGKLFHHAIAVVSNLQKAGPSQDLYQRERAELRRHTKAMIALARRLVDVLWAMLRDDRVWQPSAPETQPTT